jgi:hypothetical protein
MRDEQLSPVPRRGVISCSEVPGFASLLACRRLEPETEDLLCTADAPLFALGSRSLHTIHSVVAEAAGLVQHGGAPASKDPLSGMILICAEDAALDASSCSST